MSYTITINGKTETVDVEGDTPLLWVLRDVLDLKGSKFGCGMGLCGACTVHLNGRATRSCITPVSAIGAAQVTTIEGLGESDIGRKLQEAWVAHDVPQCGYCQAGQLMSACALLARTPRPTESEIDAAMAGNLCRCACYHRIRSAIQLAANEAGEAAHVG